MKQLINGLKPLMRRTSEKKKSTILGKVVITEADIKEYVKLQAKLMKSKNYVNAQIVTRSKSRERRYNGDIKTKQFLN